MRIAIVEDDANYASILQNYIEQYNEKYKTNYKTNWYRNGMDFIVNYRPIYDIVYLDIKMPYLDGMEAARKLREVDENVALVFVTSLMQYAIKGYEVNALDFMLKPVKYYDFELKLTKAKEYLQKNLDCKIIIDMGDIIKRVSSRDIYYIEVINHSLIYHVKDNVYKSYGNLKDLKEKLGLANFAQCNQSYLVNLRHIVEVHTDYIIIGSDKVPISRRKKKEFMKILADYMGGGF